jgi:RND family efflux transporter MFP subunit
MKSPSAVLFSAGVLCFLSACKPPNEFQPPPPPVVSVENPVMKDVTLYDTFPGRVEARDSVTLTARVSGFLNEIHFADGAPVKKGQKLFTIEQEGYLAAVNAAKAYLAQAEAGLSLAKASLSRKQKAFESQAVSELDVLTAEADVQAAEASVKSAAAGLEQAELNLSYTVIMSPMDGVMSKREVSIGNLVGPGAVSDLAYLVSVDPANVYFSIDERRLLPKMRAFTSKPDKNLKNVSPVKLVLADAGDYAVEGKIDYIDNTLNAQTGTLKVRAVFENPNGLLVEGMFARVKIPNEVTDAMLIPEVAIQRDLVGSFVYTLDDKNTVESTYIEIGALLEGRRIVTKGLTKTSRVVTKGVQRVRPGVTVSLEAATPTGE